MEVLVIGDPHFKVNNTNETNEMHMEIIEKAKSINPKFIVCLGDVLDRHETIHVSPLERATNFLFELSKISNLYVIIGNHDRPNNSNFLTKEHPFNALKYWENTYIIDDIYETYIENFKFIFVPYVPPGRFYDALNKLENFSNAKCIFAHQEFKGAKMGAIISLEGDDWPTNNPLVISGHIHDFDNLQCNIIYTGTPIQHGYEDKDNKTISLFKFTNDDYDHKRLYLNITKKKLVHLKCLELPFYEPEKGYNIKIIASGTSGEIKSVMKMEYVKKLGQKIKIVYKDLPPEENFEKKQVTKNLTFNDRLYQAISHDINLEKIYSTIFFNT